MSYKTSGTLVGNLSRSEGSRTDERNRGCDYGGVRFFKPVAYAKYIAIDVNADRRCATALEMRTRIDEMLSEYVYYMGLGLLNDGRVLDKIIRVRDELSYCRQDYFVRFTTLGRKDIHGVARLNLAGCKSKINQQTYANVYRG